jgi:glycosyltransferase involved in cell wall biosynthesis
MIGLAWAGSGQLPAGARLHAHFGWVSATAAWAAASIEAHAYTVVLHAFELHDRAYQDQFARIPLVAATTVFTISEHDQRIAGSRWGIRPRVLRMGVPEAWLTEQLTDRVSNRIIVVGSLVEKKGHRVLIDALVRTSHPWECWIIGEGPLRGDLEAQIERLGIGSRVRLLGARREHDVRHLLASGSLFCLACVETVSGDRDGIPVALIEAMAAGLPVVTTSIGAIPELVHGAGLLVAPGDSQALVHALDSLRDPELRSCLAIKARDRVRQGWTVETSAVELASCIDERSEGGLGARHES